MTIAIMNRLMIHQNRIFNCSQFLPPPPSSSPSAKLSSRTYQCWYNSLFGTSASANRSSSSRSVLVPRLQAAKDTGRQLFSTPWRVPSSPRRIDGRIRYSSTSSASSLLFTFSSVGIICGICCGKGGGGWFTMLPSSLFSIHITGCETALMVVNDDENHDNDDDTVGNTTTTTTNSNSKSKNENGNIDEISSPASSWFGIQRVLRVIRRIMKLTIVFTPVVALYPLHWISWHLLRNVNNGDHDQNNSTDAHDIAMNSVSFVGTNNWWYYRLSLWCVECSGAACIKIMQWAGSRPDMFGPQFCAIFCRLQDRVTPHSWKYTKFAMSKAYGDNWEQNIDLNANDIVGCGCIAQVYKANVIIDDFDDAEDDDDHGNEDHNNSKHDSTVVNNDNYNRNNSRTINHGASAIKKKERVMAVKVMHPNVERDIAADLDVLRLMVRILESVPMIVGHVTKDLKWLNLPGIVEEMAVMLQTQLDLRTEGSNLIRFNKNFDDANKILFPKIVPEYPPTKRVLMETYMDGRPVMEFIRTNKADQNLLTKMCTEAIQAVCQMIFLDNFTHGDLHPGNVLVTNDYKFVLLDVGITTVHSESDHRLLSDILASFIRCDGRKAGRLMIDDSNTRMEALGGEDRSIDEEKFIAEMEQLTVKAQGENYFMEHLGVYISHICRCAQTHHVMINQSFISAALAVKVQEGVALALDPSIEIWKIAIPIILEGERKHGRAAERIKEIFGVQKFVSWLTTGSNYSEEEE